MCRISHKLKRRCKSSATLSVLGAIAFAASPAGAAWSPPKGTFSASTRSVTNTGATITTVSGMVNAGGQATTYKAAYDQANSAWCSSNGTSGTPAKGTAAMSLPYVDFYYHPISVGLTGLTPGTMYCVAIVANQASATTAGSPVTFTAGAPAPVSYSVTTISPTAATLSGAVNPAGQATTYTVRYGPASSVWCGSNGTKGTPANATAAQTLPYNDGTLHDIWISLPGLASGTTYCAAISATNHSATTRGAFVSFTVEFPTVINNSVLVTGSTASVNGAVNALGESNTYYGALYDNAGSTFCATAGSTPDATTVHDVGIAYPYSDSMPHPVVVILGLAADTKYCATIEASNPTGGITQAVPMYFTTPPAQ